jgi:hypothetical protein
VREVSSAKPSIVAPAVFPCHLEQFVRLEVHHPGGCQGFDDGGIRNLGGRLKTSHR